MARYRRQAGDAKGGGEAHRAAADRTGNLRRGTLAKGGADFWLITAPDGTQWRTRGLADWCRKHDKLIGGGTWRTMYYGLKTAGQKSGWHGWTAVKVGGNS